MKKILFVLSVILMLVVAACSTPTADTGNKETQNVNKPANDTPNTPAPQQPETPAQPQTPTQPETPAQPQTPSQPQQPQTPTQPEQPPAPQQPQAPTQPEQPPAPESQPENEDSDEEETQEETEQGGESEEETEQEESEEETPEETPQVPEDKSPFEYVKPACVNLADYTYVGDYIFADTMNFAEWKYSNAETEYRLAFEKVARVKNDNPETRIVRVNHNEPDTEISVIKATRYKIYVKTTIVEATTIGTNCFTNYLDNISGNYDGTVFRVKKLSNNTFEIMCRYETYSDVLNNYVAY